MLHFMDKWLEKKIAKSMHKKRKKIIDEVFNGYVKSHPLTDGESELLREKMEVEADRVCAMADRSIIRASIQRAKYTFLGAVFAGTAVVVMVSLFTGFTALPFIAPVISGTAAWVVAIGLIPTSYIQRLKGGMDSVVVLYDDSSRESKMKEKNLVESKNRPDTTTELLQTIPILIQKNPNMSLEQISTTILNDKNNIKGVFLWKKPQEETLQTDLVEVNKADDVFVTFVMNGPSK